MRVLAIDFGEARCGLAVGDLDGGVATPHGVVRRGSDASAIEAIVRVVAEEEVTQLVLGLPLHPEDRSRGPAAERIERFAVKLREGTGLPVDLVEETLTTVAAAERLRAAGVDPRRYPERLDAMAAAIVLEDYLATSLAGRR